MAERESLLLALLAPGSVEAAVCREQDAIFREHGLVSAIALPPLVPVAFLGRGLQDRAEGEELPRGFLGRIERAVRAPYRFTVAGMAWEGGALFLALDSGGVWRALRAACAPETGGPDLFPVFEGFFLGCVEATDAQRESIRAQAYGASFSSVSLALVSILTPEAGAGWWSEVSCAVEEEKPLRGKRE
jgi:hypothetical protein